MSYNITLIPGDGIGPEVIAAARRVLEATDLSFDWDVQHAGAGVMGEQGTPLPDQVLTSIREHGVALKGPITTPVGSGFRSVNVAIRRALDLYANVRPVKSLPGIPGVRQDIDLVVVRENTEGLYVGIEHEVMAGEVAEAIRVITRKGSERVVRFACEYARTNGRRKVTAVHKANILKLTDGLFLETARQVAQDYPDLEFESCIVDALCMHLVMRPQVYDVLVLPNLYGDIVSDLCSGLVGGLGLTPGANIGEEVAVFEPVHGSAPDIAGSDRANPCAAILTAALMLHHLGEDEAAAEIESAVTTVLRDGHVITADLKTSGDGRTLVGTQAMADAIVQEMASGS